MEALAYDPTLAADVAGAAIAVGGHSLPLRFLGAARSLREQALPLLARGVLGFVHTTVHEWLRQEPRQPSAEDLTALLSQSLWHMVAGHLSDKGVSL